MSVYFPSSIFSNLPPTPNEVKFGSLAINNDKIFTKTIGNTIVEVGKGVSHLYELEDVRINNPKNGEVLIYNNGFWENKQFIYSFSNFVDAEFTNLRAGQTILYNPETETFVNGNLFYRLRDLLDFDKPPDFERLRGLYDGQVLEFNSATNKFQFTHRNNRFSLLEDVHIDPDRELSIVKSYDNGVTWVNSALRVEDDPEPELGGDLNANFRRIANLKHTTKILIVTESRHFINYGESEYWVIRGTDIDTILDIRMAVARNVVTHLLLQITQGRGLIQLGGLDNVIYSDGRPVALSGFGKTDIISITRTDNNSIITLVARDIQPAKTNSELNNFDLNRYPDLQNFTIPLLFDNFFSYTRLLLTFEATGRTKWYENKTSNEVTVTLTNVTERRTDVVNLHRRESVASFNDAQVSNLTAVFREPVLLTNDFTYEMFIQYEVGSSLNNGINQTIFNLGDVIKLEYLGTVNFTNLNNSNKLRLTIGTTTHDISSGILYFKNALNYYFHIMILRLNSILHLMIDGISIFQIESTETFSIDRLVMSNFRANVNSVRLTTMARYDKNLDTLPNMKFPLLDVFQGDDLFEDIVMNKWYFMGEMSDPIAYMMYAS